MPEGSQEKHRCESGKTDPADRDGKSGQDRHEKADHTGAGGVGEEPSYTAEQKAQCPEEGGDPKDTVDHCEDRENDLQGHIIA